MGTEASNPVKTSSERARAWLATSINPLLRALELEEGYLSRERWTWRFHLQQCELLQPCRSMVPSLYAENLDDLLRKQRDLDQLVSQHDERLEALLAALRAAQAELEANDGFRQRVAELLEEHLADESDDRPWGALTRDKIFPLAAQYLLNGITESYQGETMFRFWNQFGNRLRTEFASHADRIKPFGAQLLEAVQALRQSLTGLKYSLCDEHDLPPVPVTGGSPLPYPERF